MEYKKYSKNTKEGYTYIEIGQGPPMVLLHGLFGAFSNFEGVIKHFSKTYKIIMPLLPIYTQPIATVGVRYLTKYVAKFIKTQDIQNFILLGNSLGGHLGLYYTVHFENTVKGLLLTGSSGLYENAFGGSFPKRSDRKFLREKIALTFYDPNTVTEEMVDDLQELLGSKSRVIRILRVAKSAIRNNMKDDLEKVKIPVGLIWGKNDGITPPYVAETFNDLLPQSNLYWIDKCGHAPMMEQPEEFIRLFEEWLKLKNF